MTILDIKNILNCDVLCGENKLNTEVKTGCGADLMSDVLAFVKDRGILLTGLINPQVVRTAEMMDIVCVVFVRGKTPDQAMVDLASECDIVMMRTQEKMFASCGKLFEAGLRGDIYGD